MRLKLKWPPCSGPWNVSFQPGRGAPASITMDQLSDWSQSSDPGVKYFSGIGTYTTTVQASPDWFRTGARLWLDLGDVKNLAVVSVNGKEIGRDVARAVSRRRDLGSQTRCKRDHNQGGERVGEPADRRRAAGSHENHLCRREALQGGLASAAFRPAWTGDSGSAGAALGGTRILHSEGGRRSGRTVSAFGTVGAHFSFLQVRISVQNTFDQELRCYSCNQPVGSQSASACFSLPRK